MAAISSRLLHRPSAAEGLRLPSSPVITILVIGRKWSDLFGSLGLRVTLHCMFTGYWREPFSLRTELSSRARLPCHYGGGVRSVLFGGLVFRSVWVRATRSRKLGVQKDESSNRLNLNTNEKPNIGPLPFTLSPPALPPVQSESSRVRDHREKSVPTDHDRISGDTPQR